MQKPNWNNISKVTLNPSPTIPTLVPAKFPKNQNFSSSTPPPKIPESGSTIVERSLPSQPLNPHKEIKSPATGPTKKPNFKKNPNVSTSTILKPMVAGSRTPTPKKVYRDELERQFFELPLEKFMNYTNKLSTPNLTTTSAPGIIAKKVGS